MHSTPTYVVIGICVLAMRQIIYALRRSLKFPVPWDDDDRHTLNIPAVPSHRHRGTEGERLKYGRVLALMKI